MSSELKEGIYTYANKVKGQTGRVSLEHTTSQRGVEFWVIRYNQGWNPNDAPLFGHAIDFEVLDLDYAEELISDGRLKPVKGDRASFSPTPVAAGRRSRRTRRKTRARKSRRYRK
jgi:hypothetical protein